MFEPEEEMYCRRVAIHKLSEYFPQLSDKNRCLIYLIATQKINNIDLLHLVPIKKLRDTWCGVPAPHNILVKMTAIAYILTGDGGKTKILYKKGFRVKNDDRIALAVDMGDDTLPTIIFDMLEERVHCWPSIKDYLENYDGCCDACPPPGFQAPIYTFDNGLI